MDWDSSVYLVVVVATGIVLLVGALLSLARIQRRRTDQLRRRSWLEATKTSTPLDNPLEVSRERGLENIRRNTTVIRRALVPVVVLCTALLAAVPSLGDMPTALVSVVAAVLTVTGGIAARPIIENVFSGLVISFSRLMNIGDTVVIDELYGTVEDVTMTHTTIRLWDWRRYVVPNSKMMQSSLVNYSLRDTFQWAYVEFWVAHDTDLERVRALAIAAAEGSEHFAPHEPARFWVMELADRGVRCWVAGWADTPSAAWALKHDMRTSLVLAMHEHGISPHVYRVELSPASVPSL